MEYPSQGKEQILDLQEEIRNLKNMTSRWDHNMNEYNTKKTQGKYYR